MLLRCDCNQSIRLQPEHVGRLTACPRCQTPLRLIAADPHDRFQVTAKLLIESGPDRAGERIFVGSGQTLSIGKSKDNHLRLHSSGVSRVHCRLIPNHDRWRVQDDNSTNGLFVNGHRTHDHDLSDGDLIQIGEFELRFCALQSSADASGATSLAALSSGHDTLNELELGQTAGATAANQPSATGDDEGGFTFIDEDFEQNAARPGSPPPVTSQPSKCPKCATPLATGARICVQCGYDVQSGRRVKTVAILKAEKPAKTGGVGAYLADCAKSAAFISDSGNLISFIFVAILAALSALFDNLPFSSCIFFFVGLIFKGLLAAFYFNVVLNAANNDDSLPDIGFSGDWWEDIFAPFFKFTATWLIALIPFLIYMQNVGWAGGSMLGNVSTLAFAVFSWPIIMLIMAMGGIECFLRPDQIALTIARAFIPYLMACFVTGLAFGITWISEFGLTTATANLGGNKWAVLTVLWLLKLYFTIVAMRCVGLYYYHFKDRFAWSWG